ncbi:ABC transporter permease [Catenulispora sp. NF23]|uniref:ABC transporter permease n=1 Tax=Catenulispora pinistramenti TaxID=2705254 RepID=A0ABS5KU80_9ACTN|nr:ABC transporter permease [Catenulispora pinistramenti]MBS2538174.1 ABC transporter permease [Catenulispora pinistramenti]MBS2549608.1 ABC transporter permease [Catenulispora pinistramenti]
MGAVWLASRAAVKRRRLQSVVIGLVVLFSTATFVVALGLLAASSAPFTNAYARGHGAHVVADFDMTAVSGAQLARAAEQPGVEAVAGPFGKAVLTITENKAGFPFGPLTVVGRADPAGPVDRLDLWAGRWATGPGEIVMNRPSGQGLVPRALGDTFQVPGGPLLTIVGFADSVSQSAGAWVSPGQIGALHPSEQQMLYRFKDSSTDAEIRSGLASVTAGLPPGALVESQSYLVLKRAFAAGPGAYVPFLMVFGVLGIVVAVLIVANVVSGAVVTGFRHIGVLKALGFTPNQVAAVYLTMISVPAIAGCALGVVLGNILAKPLLSGAFQGLDVPNAGVGRAVDVTCLLGVPVLVAVAALGPALRARGLSAVEAISAGSTPRAGRALRAQRWLAGTRLPRPISLGLGLPIVRPARVALTMAAIVLGVITVTFATGLTNTMVAYGKAQEANGAVQVTVRAADPGDGQTARRLGDSETEGLLRSLPGAVHVTAGSYADIYLGSSQTTDAEFLRGDSSTLGYLMVKGHWMNGAGQIVARSDFLHQRGLAVGDQTTLDLGGKRTQVRIVGEFLAGGFSVFCDWATLTELAPDQQATDYEIQLAPGTNTDAYIAAFTKAAGTGLNATADTNQTSVGTVVITSFASIFTLMLGLIAAMGVFNTVVLNTRERRRNLGMLKSIGMTPRQVTFMMITSMVPLGVIGGLLGLPVGIIAHRLIVPASARAAGIDMPASMMHVWHAPMLSVLALAGVLIAVLGAFIPARAAARLTVAEVLRSE